METRGKLDEDHVDRDPLAQFRAWLDDARAAGVFEPEAAALATATPDGAPSARMVLLKGFDERGFRFFTSYESRKGAELEANPRAALLLHWKELGRQVRIEGPVEHLSRRESAEYARTRSRASRLSALASPQSRVVASREELEALVAQAGERHRDGEIPLPDHWGGYLLSPQVYELWQHREHRLHDRLRYRRGWPGPWVVERLGP
ncbi:MAG TPA: pyridoxamine 5'-phosphate oxidase [Thermoleophilaceae bacterium]|nr:pyridoxamine 5'-phosphate oxidase [Thermoleophilaceae bacterium]